MRDFAVDLEKRFLKLTRREPNLYSDPNSILVEQFVEGIEDRFIRNSCRDLYDRWDVVNFRDLREFAIRRAGQETSLSETRGGRACSRPVNSLCVTLILQNM